MRILKVSHLSALGKTLGLILNTQDSVSIQPFKSLDTLKHFKRLIAAKST